MHYIYPGSTIPYPSTCVSCGGGDKSKGFIDTGRTENHVGQYRYAILICVDCYRHVGLNTPELQVVDAVEHNNEIMELNDDIERTKYYRNRFGSLVSTLDDVINHFAHDIDEQIKQDRLESESNSSGESTVPDEDDRNNKDESDSSSDSISGLNFFASGNSSTDDSVSSSKRSTKLSSS